MFSPHYLHISNVFHGFFTQVLHLDNFSQARAPARPASASGGSEARWFKGYMVVKWWRKDLDTILTGWWFQPLWKVWKSIGMIIPNIWENKTCSKPPTRRCYRGAKLSWWNLFSDAKKTKSSRIDVTIDVTMMEHTPQKRIDCRYDIWYVVRWCLNGVSAAFNALSTNWNLSGSLMPQWNAVLRSTKRMPMFRWTVWAVRPRMRRVCDPNRTSWWANPPSW